jgi:hypothetical protein
MKLFELKLRNSSSVSVVSFDWVILKLFSSRNVVRPDGDRSYIVFNSLAKRNHKD